MNNTTSNIDHMTNDNSTFQEEKIMGGKSVESYKIFFATLRQNTASIKYWEFFRKFKNYGY